MSNRSGVLVRMNQRMRASGDESGAALVSVLLFMVLVGGMSLVMLGVMLGQAVPSLQAQKQAQTGYVAQAGLQATLNTIRSIDKSTTLGVFGDRTQLPCTLSGNVDGSSSALNYQVTIEYFSTDPTYETATWRASHKLACTSGFGVSPQPQFAFIQSRGIGPTIVNQAATVGNRGIAAVYAFKMSNINVPGGLLLTSSTGFCVRAAGAYAGATLTFVTKANCTNALTDNWIYNTDIQFELASSTSATYPNGLCITQGAPTGITYPLTLQPCLLGTNAGRWNQLWSIDGGTTLWGQKNPVSSGRSSVCLAFQNVYAGGTVQASTSNCDGWAPDYKVGSGVASKVTDQIVSFGEFGRCMDVTNGDINYSHMIVWPCKQDPTGAPYAQLNWNHRFYYNEPNVGLTGSISTTITVKVGNSSASTYCMQTPDSASASKYPIFVACNGSARQQWTRTAASATGYANSWIFQDTYGRCITPLQTDLFSWVSKLGVEACTGTTIQKWNAPPYTTEAVIGGYKEISG